jgi:asparagine synthase (glutamine-hydrolysing)
MCGIFGVISKNFINKERIENVSQTISHRGPDDEGGLAFNIDTSKYQSFLGKDTISEINLPHISETQCKYNSVFLHRRLSIIDLSPYGHQPLCYNNGEFWIVFNGEIYNYIEIKRELFQKGYRFNSTSDTEVVLASYMEWGRKCVERFNGMWAFAIWDRNNKSMFLSRDRLGIKPLLYYFKNNIFIFCSEIKGIQKYLDVNLTLNELAFYKFAYRGTVKVGEDESTMFNEIKQLMPGTNLLFKDNRIKTEKYWELYLKNNNLSFSDNVLRFKELFHSSINYRLRSDVEVGSCLSGGIDSSSIVSFMSEEFNKKFHTFSAVWPGEACDESYYIGKVNNKFNCISHAFTPDIDNLLELVEKVVWHQEIPLAGPSVIAQWAVMEEARKNNIKVLLDGQGADEILSGYPVYLSTYIKEMMFKLKWMQLIKYYPSLYNNGFSLKTFIKLLIRRNIQNTQFKIPVLEKFENKFDFIESKIDTRYNFLPHLLKTEIQSSNLPSLLHFEDSNSMAHSVEARVPYLDHRLVEFAINIPSEQKIRGTLTKIILREAMKDYIPVEVYNRRDKIGFETPIENKYLAVNGRFHKQIWNYIESSKLPEFEIFDFNEIKKSNGKWINFVVFSTAIFVNKFCS